MKRQALKMTATDVRVAATCLLGAALALITATLIGCTDSARWSPETSKGTQKMKAAKISEMFLRFYFAQAAAGAAVGFVIPIVHALLRL